MATSMSDLHDPVSSLEDDLLVSRRVVLRDDVGTLILNTVDNCERRREGGGRRGRRGEEGRGGREKEEGGGRGGRERGKGEGRGRRKRRKGEGEGRGGREGGERQVNGCSNTEMLF